jgi:hypothetical protein
MAYTITADDYLQIGSVPLSTTAWALENSYELWAGADTRGRNRLIPGATGVRKKAVRATETSVTLTLAIWGEKDWNNNVNADASAGLYANISHLRTNVTDPTGVGDGTRTATLHLPSGSTISGPIQVRRFRFIALSPTTVEASMEITIPAGALA